MFTKNGTDEGVLREWLDREAGEWERAFSGTLDDAVEQLQALCFVEIWDELLDSGRTQEEVARETVELYQRGIADVFSFVRAAGVLPDQVSWSTMKTEYRRAATEPHMAVAVREALEAGMYESESIPLGSHGQYRSWIRGVMLFLFQHAAERSPEYPGPAATEHDKLSWAYDALQDVEEHQVFHEGVADYLRDTGVAPVVEAVTGDGVEDIVRFEASLLAFQRFDLVLNSGLRWLAGAAERR